MIDYSKIILRFFNSFSNLAKSTRVEEKSLARIILLPFITYACYFLSFFVLIWFYLGLDEWFMADLENKHRKSIELKQITFKYKDGHKEVLRGDVLEEWVADYYSAKVFRQIHG